MYSTNSCAGAKLSLTKGQWCRSRVEYVGLLVGADGIEPQSSRVQAIRDIKSPTNVSELHFPFPYTPSRMLRSQGTGLLVIPRVAKSTIGGRAFSYRAPHLWNKLPAHVRSADTITLFKARLKTYLFSLSYS